MWDFSGTKLHWGKFLSKNFDLPLPQRYICRFTYRASKFYFPRTVSNWIVGVTCVLLVHDASTARDVCNRNCMPWLNCVKTCSSPCHFLCIGVIIIQGDQKVSAHLCTIPTQLMIWIWQSQNTFGMWTVLYWTRSSRTQFGVSINVWRLAGDTLNITCNFLYCNHQVHRDFLIIL